MRAVDLFSGCGGLSLGLQNAGLEVVAAYEYWSAAVKLYQQNFDHPVFEFDLTDVENAVDHIKQFSPDIIVGGPPCQDFSSAGKRNENGTRGDLTISFAKIVIGVLPNWFLMENVERIKKTGVFAEAKNLLKEAGYSFTEMVLDASKCGVPQKRKRMILIGRLDSYADFLKYGLLSRLANKSMTIRDYLGDQLNTEHYYRHARSYARRGIFSIDEPSPTIRGVNRPIPPGYVFHEGDSTKELEHVRPLTAIERSYIQTFPRTFIWNGLNKTTLEQIIGNAVPVNLAKYVGDCILAYKEEESGILQFAK
ncbi:DNA (cytosine-5)-methyltransferase 1 [Algoriphagus alkaliphilus]|uniref:Cytosine-specific methyltransferase n=1 Tax=Algoriphagus alkaliphilus TaxID=279824 RepID=A0A1G5YYU7_9BACT|nr:DNA cytosine methyltransferase [Algoriphagus alkaliphilus]SDA87305.1 DNA (cytosine-5)-methyltransferase 1 [Algoriphagus alkaliphilus]